ncbi:hypothetical protein OAR55_02650 [Gammaproteobacteria bacterium]|nr:hypothetical protein [Gammaproteobacteria bacterium]MDC0962323.1 hypothetical protein [Gammaproteobacteria bacterium]
MSKYFLSFLFLFSLEIISEDVTSVNIGEEWFLNSRSNKLSPTNSKVLYFMPNDAYHTYRARQFGDWDVFSIVDDRNLERLNKGDVIQILEPSFNEKIYKVKLMNGSSKNKDFFIITEDLIKYYMPLEEQNNE